MSLSSLATEEIQRTEKPSLEKGANPPAPRKGSNSFDFLAHYIPTEAITLYVAACSAMFALKETFAWITEARVYWAFVVFTPLLFLILFCGQRRKAALRLFPPFAQWPWWKLTSCTVAFAVWALAIPTTPYLQGTAGGAVAALGAMVVSTFLTLLQPIFERKEEERARE